MFKLFVNTKKKSTKLVKDLLVFGKKKVMYYMRLVKQIMNYLSAERKLDF